MKAEEGEKEGRGPAASRLAGPYTYLPCMKIPRRKRKC